ncbi:hypothetical protein OIY81_1322 [Cryptosporidium canis]|uniref:Uncharacterized protein n=1 Tax=Cryptosporidium canis TaxID=195482 RepID=A0ABQ8P2G8_9CRYT|nr:hypothetical protein OJ252_3385 [Cryptosporidium canis]KAJ1612289.1 hypothetical protein OIY81_1322 [Cryptosporidium canis]
MKSLIGSHNKKGRIKATLKKAPSELWYTIFDQEITNIIANHPFVDQLTWIKPNIDDENLKELNLERFVGSKFYHFENIFPSSALSIPFIQNSVISNNGALISLSSLPIQSNCTIAIFHRQIKLSLIENVPELLAIIRTPNVLFKNVINVDKFMKLPPHMKKSSQFSFHKIELSEKSYWNDKLEVQNKSSYTPDIIHHKEYSDPTQSEFFSFSTEINSFFFNPLLSNHNNTNSPKNPYKKTIYACASCVDDNKTLKDYCYCKAIKESKNPPSEPSCKSLSYNTKGLGNNPYYFSLQKQFCQTFFTKSDFLCYFDSDSPFGLESETDFLKSLETTLCLNGSPNAKITPINVKLLVENVNIKLLKRGYDNKNIEMIYDSTDKDIHVSEMLSFIDLNTLNSLMKNSSGLNILNTMILEQIIEYFDIIIHQNLFSVTSKNLVNPLDSWDSRFDRIAIDKVLDAQNSCSLLKNVPLKEAPSKIFKAIGLIRPTIVQRYIWFIANLVASGTLLWSLIHIKGNENSPISINYKPHFSDEAGNSINDLYILMFRENEEINMLCIHAVNYNDANL